MTVKYEHTEEVHNFKAPIEVVPIILELINPKSVVDVGCGIGTWLSIFINNGVQNILGIDGDYVNRDQLTIPEHYFLPKDIEKEISIKKRFDLVVSLEVAEHLKENTAHDFVNSLVKLGDTILFSAAIKSQGGQNHLNEQNPNYWIEIFKNKGYVLYDVLRPIFWDNENVNWWYRQNMMIFSKKSELGNKLKKLDSFYGKTLVHPVLFKNRSFEVDRMKSEFLRIENGKKAFGYYLDLLIKSIKNKLKFKK